MVSSRVSNSTKTNYASALATLSGTSFVNIVNTFGWTKSISSVPGYYNRWIVSTTHRLSSHEDSKGTGYKLPINPYIAEEKYYSVISGSDFVGSQFGSINFTSAICCYFFWNLSTNINYYDPSSTSKYEENISHK